MKVWGLPPELTPVQGLKGLHGNMAICAMDEEMNSIKVNEVWIEVDPPSNAKVVRSKWLFKKKTDMDGEVHTYKARLVAKGYTQPYRNDTTEKRFLQKDIRAIKDL
ncbi:retrotransposon protein, putative, ty1-copia subclass [Tanacetum coccineum]